MVIIIVGGQWGDEGKGKVIDYLSEQAHLVIRPQGGNNAGHTVITEHGEFKFQLLPSGILYPQVTCVIGNGVVVDPRVVLKEIEQLRERGLEPHNLVISERAHMVMSYHPIFDRLEEGVRGDDRLGTTWRGVGPAYGDKVRRIGFRIGDLQKEVFMRKKIDFVVGQVKNPILDKLYGEEQLDKEIDAISDDENRTLRDEERLRELERRMRDVESQLRVFEREEEDLDAKQDRLEEEAERRMMPIIDEAIRTGLAKRYPAQLSGGQRQRMGLARALAVDPKVLLLDEPFGALDARVRKELREWLLRLHDEMHVTTIFVTHDQEEALELADSIAVMNTGRIEQVAPPRELYDEPANAFVMSFVGPVNRLGETWVRPHDIEISHEPNGVTQEAQVERIVRLGFEVRVDLVRDDGERVHVQLTRNEAEVLELAPSDIVYVRTRRERTFSESVAPMHPAPASAS